LGRRWIGIELSPNYTKVANDRIAKFKAEQLQVKMEL